MPTDTLRRVRLTNTVFFAQSLFSAAQIAIITLLSIVAVEISGRESLAGVPSTTLTLTQAATALPLGLLMGRLGRRVGLTLSYSVSILGAFVGVVAVTQGWFWLLLISSAMLGAGRAGGDQSRYAVGDMFAGGDRAKMIGRVVFAGTAGAIFGPLLVAPSGQVAALLGLPENAGPWGLGVILYAVAAGVILFLLVPDPLTLAVVEEDEDDSKKTSHAEAHRTPRQLLQTPSVQLAVLSMLISQLVMVALMVITPVHMGHHDYEQGAVSIVIMAHTLGMFGFSSFTGYLIARFGIHWTMLVGTIILVASAVISPLSVTMPVLIVGLFLLGLGWNFCYIAGSALLSEGLSTTERGSLQGLSDMMVALAAALGSFSSGPIFGLGDYVAVAGAGLVVLLLFLFAIRILRAQIDASLPQTASAMGD